MGAQGSRVEGLPRAGPVRQVEPVVEGGLVGFLPCENCFIPQILTSFFAKILFNVNIVLLRLITFFCMSRDMKLFPSISIRCWDHPNGPILRTKWVYSAIQVI